MLLKLSQHQKAPNSITDQNFCIKTCHIPSQKDKNPCIKVSNTRTGIHRLVFNTQRAQFTHWKDIPTKSSILTELQSLQISCPQSQRKLYSCRILFYIRSSQCISLQSLQNILHSKAAITLSASFPVPVWHPAISWSDDLGHSATKNPNKLARENPET